MNGPFEELAGLDRLVHEPARLALLTVLEACDRADFRFLRRLTGLTKGNLSAHVGKLESAGLVEVTKRFEGKRPETWIALTVRGRRAITQHWDSLAALRDEALGWRGSSAGDRV